MQIHTMITARIIEPMLLENPVKSKKKKNNEDLLLEMKTNQLSLHSETEFVFSIYLLYQIRYRHIT